MVYSTLNAKILVLNATSSLFSFSPFLARARFSPSKVSAFSRLHLHPSNDISAEGDATRELKLAGSNHTRDCL